MPTDPVYNPHLPSSSEWTPSSPFVSDTRWSSDMRTSSGSAASFAALSAGFLAGAVAGAAIALIFAPARGAEFRGSLRRYASANGERLSRLVENGRSAAEDALNRMSALVEQGRGALRTDASSETEPRWSERASAVGPESTRAGSQPLTASVAEISGIDRRFEEPLGG